uniref:Uncharacterized protein n=1 Tax=Meleagris gallopavo TaxID=9103 RepID=A0A803YAI9_MELGA
SEVPSAVGLQEQVSRFWVFHPSARCPSVKIVGLGEADRLAVLQGCPGIPGAAGPKGKPGLSGTKGEMGIKASPGKAGPPGTKGNPF